MTPASMASSSCSTPVLSPPSSTPQTFKFPSSKPAPFFFTTQLRPLSSSIRLRVSFPTNDNSTTTAVSSSTPKKAPAQERIFFDGGAHYGDLVANLFLGFTLLWLPLTLAAVSRAFFLRYRFSNLRVTVISGLTGQDRNDFSYKVIKEVQVVPRFIGEWGDIVITLTDGTKVDLRSVPRFREIADYCLLMADKQQESVNAVVKPKGF